MFKEQIIEWLTYINDMIVNAGQNDTLSMAINKFNPTLYGYVITIMQSVVMPVAYVILALFFTMELYKVSVKIESAGGGGLLGVEMLFKTMLKMALCKLAVEGSLIIMEGIYGVFLHVTQGISGILSTGGSVNSGMDLAALTQMVNDMDLGQQIGTFMEVFIITKAVQIIMLLVKVIVVARFIEILVNVAISPMPIATFPSEELSSIGKNFLKGFAAVSLQGALIYLVLSFFPILFNSAVLGSMNGATSVSAAISPILGYSIILALAVFLCGKWAKSICNAM